MDFDIIIKRLEFHESCILKPYYCPTGHLTLGIGHNIDARAFTNEEKKAIGDWKKGITKNMAYMICRNDVNICLNQLKTLPFWNRLDLERQYALLDMCFQLGFKGVCGFKKMLEAMRWGKWDKAAAECLNSDYARQTPARAKRIARLIKEGIWLRE
jgi:lysozyme